MRLPARLDRFVEHALLGDLMPSRQRILHALLALNAGLGVGVAFLQPEVAALALLFPCLVLVFFGAPGRYSLIWIGLFALLQPTLAEVSAFTLAVLLGSLFAHVTAERYRQSRTRELELERAMAMARRRQKQLEPPARQMLLGRLEVASYLQVCRSLGGDFLCVRTYGGDRASVVLGDVMGKGLPAGLVAVYLEGVCHQLGDLGLEPGPLLTALNHSLTSFETEDPLFATAVCVEADFAAGRWKVARAGHEVPVLGGQAVEMEAHLPLGLQPGMDVAQVELPLNPGDSLVLVSDGVTDRLGPLEEAGVGPGSAAQVLASLVARLGEGLEDDATIAVLSIPSGAP